MKISPVFLQDKNLQKSNFQKNSINSTISNNTQLQNVYPKSYYLLNFEARVDKDLDSFIKRNEQNLPYSVKAYVENLTSEEKISLSPLEAQRNAFEYLSICDSVNDIKDVYPEESLFKNLREAGEIKSKRGFLYELRLMSEDLDKDKLLSTGDNSLSVYLIKKIFLEGKTIDEINNDLDKDIHPAFKKEDKKYIQSSTLKALGIELPPLAYLNSLRYTRDGYSDFVGDKISKHWAQMSQEEKDNIRNSHSSKSFSQEAKDNMSIAQKKRWAKMSPQERTEQINKMHTGDEKQKYALIAAWNECPEARKVLSEMLIEHHFYSPQNVIYRSEALSEGMQKVMNEFWAKNPELGATLGELITQKQEEYDLAKESGNLEEFIQEIIAKQKEIKAEIKQLSIIKKKELANFNPLVEQYKKDFSFLPDELLELHEEILKMQKQDEVEIFIKYLKGEKLKNAERKTAQKIQRIVMPKFTIENQAFLMAYMSEFEKAFANFKNPINGNELCVSFPSNCSFDSAMIIQTCYRLLNEGYENVNFCDNIPFFSLNDKKAPACLYNDIDLQIALVQNKNLAKIIEPISSDLKHFKYPFAKLPDFKAANEAYSKIINKNPCEKDVRRLAIKMAGLDAGSEIINKMSELLMNRKDAYWILENKSAPKGVRLRTMCQAIHWCSGSEAVYMFRKTASKENAKELEAFMMN